MPSGIPVFFFITKPMKTCQQLLGLILLFIVACRAEAWTVKLSEGWHVQSSDKVQGDGAFFIRLMAKDDRDELLCPAFWSDNYISLAPGQQRTIVCTLPVPQQKAVHFSFEGWNVRGKIGGF